MSTSAAAAAPSRATRAATILVNTLSSYLRDVVDILTFLVLTPFLIQVLGKETFGLWSLIWSVVSLFALADMGFGTSVVKYVADARGRGDTERLTRVVSTMFWVYTGLGTVLMGLVGVGMVFLPQAFDIPPAQADAARMVLLLLGLRSALCMPLGLFRGVLNGFQRIRVANLYKVLASILYFGGVLLILSRVRDIRMLAWINLCMGVLPMLAMMLHARATLPGVSISPRHFRLSLVRELSGFSLYFFLIQISALIYTRVDSIVIQTSLGLEAVAVYTIAIRLSDKAGQFCNQLTRTLTPVVAELHGAGDRERVISVWMRGARYATAFALPLLLGLAVLARPLIEAWAGEGFEGAVLCCRLLVAATLVAVVHGNTNNLLSMVGQHRFLALAMLLSQAVNVLLSLVLVRFLGLAGVALATLLVQIPLSAGAVQGRAGRLYDFPRRRFYGKVLGPSLLPALGMLAFLAGLQALAPVSGLLGVAAAEALACALFWGLFWAVGLSPSERQTLGERLRRRLPGRRS